MRHRTISSARLQRDSITAKTQPKPKAATTHRPPRPANRKPTRPTKSAIIRVLSTLKPNDRHDLMAAIVTARLISRGVTHDSPDFARLYREETDNINTQIAKVKAQRRNV